MRAHLPVAALLALASVLAPTVSGQEPVRLVRVAILEDGPRTSRDLDLPLLKAMLEVELAGEFGVLFPSDQHWIADGTANSAAALAGNLLSQRHVDLLIATGPLGSAALLEAEEPSFPCLAAGVVDASLQDAPWSGGGSGRPNLAYLFAPLGLDRDLAAFGEFVDLRRPALVAGTAELTGLASMWERMRAEFEASGLDLRLVRAGNTGESPLAHLPEDVDSVWVSTITTALDGRLEELADELVERGLPGFALLGRDPVARGLFAAQDVDRSDDARIPRIAELARRLLEGEPAERLPVTLGGDERLVINAATTRALGLAPGFDLLAEAELLGEEEEPATTYSLASVMTEALRVDWNLRAAELALMSGLEDVALARSPLFPQVDLSAAWTVIDEDQANLGRAERTLSGRIGATQVLWAEGLLAGLDVEEELQAARERDVEAERLDVVEGAAVAYFDVLRAKSLLRVRRGDLALTRSNLELARDRSEIGVSEPSEVYRWESQLAAARAAVVDAMAAVEIAELGLNRVLDRPLEEPFATSEVDLFDTSFVVDPRLEGFLDDPWNFRHLRDFQVLEGLRAAPELASLDASIRAAERGLASARRAHWQPIVSLDGSLVDVFDADGTGSTIPPAFSGIIPDPELTTWSASLVGTFPLLTGGEKSARERQARHELVSLRFRRQALAHLVEQSIRARLHAASASFTGIGLSRAAQTAAGSNLELVADAYSRGVASTIELLEAQNAALTAQEASVAAVHDFAVDLVGVQRAVGTFILFLSPADREAWFAELEEFARARSGGRADR